MSRNHERLIHRTIDALREDNISATAVPTTGPGTAGPLARWAVENGADLILAAGGDGTVNEVANGMVYTNVPLAVLPAGTANVLAVELGIGTRLERAVRHVASSVPERISVGRLRDHRGNLRYFLLMAGAGLDAGIVCDVHPGFKAFAGKLAYWVAGAPRFLGGVPQLSVRVNQRVYRCGFALASRVRNYGGDLEIACGASLLEDDFEVVLFESRNPFRYLAYLLGAFFGGVEGMPGIRVLHAQQAEFFDPGNAKIHLQIDGEYAGTLPAAVEIVPSALTLLVPPDLRERLAVRAGQFLPVPSS